MTLYPHTEQEVTPMHNEVQWRERLMTRMVQVGEYQEAMGHVAFNLRQGDPLSIRGARTRLAALQAQLAKFDADLAMLQADAEVREDDKNKALGIERHPTRRADGRTPNPAVASAALATAIQDGAETYNFGPDVRGCQCGTFPEVAERFGNEGGGTRDEVKP